MCRYPGHIARNWPATTTITMTALSHFTYFSSPADCLLFPFWSQFVSGWSGGCFAGRSNYRSAPAPIVVPALIVADDDPDYAELDQMLPRLWWAPCRADASGTFGSWMRSRAGRGPAFLRHIKVTIQKPRSGKKGSYKNRSGEKSAYLLLLDKKNPRRFRLHYSEPKSACLSPPCLSLYRCIWIQD
jgi:hypothetical protein